jgi:hypothetical protein
MRTVVAHALPLIFLVTSLYGYWFGIADRYRVFLYDHLGAGAFDPITRSRYWMAGLVAGGIAQGLIIPSCLILGRWHRYRPPEWWKVWLMATMILLPALMWITMILNIPTLPMPDSLMASAAACAALALAILPARMAAEQPIRLIWLTTEGLATGLMVITLLAADMPFRGLSVKPAILIGIVLGSVIGAGLWLKVITWLRRRYGMPLESLQTRLIASACIAYLLLPLAHHLFATPPGYKYISTGANFFAVNGLVQSVIWAGVVTLVWADSRLQDRSSR